MNLERVMPSRWRGPASILRSVAGFGRLTVFGVTLAVATGVLVFTGTARAQPPYAQYAVDVLHWFAGGATDGAYPGAALIQATDGNFYGTTNGGGTAGVGTVFTMTPSGTVTVLHAFAGGTDGAGPAALIQATDGNFYGTTNGGGTAGVGTVFTMTPSGTVTVLHAFAGGTDGAGPVAALIQATDGNFYGTTRGGGASGVGTVFKMTRSGTVTVLHTFAGGRFPGSKDGGEPTAALIQATDGNFYGTTTLGGGMPCPGFLQGCGTVFKMTPSGTVTVLHAFTGYGSVPVAALIQATDGNFYGTTFYSNTSNGTVFQMSASGGDVTVLHGFTGGTDADGSAPYAALIQATDGNFYGTTSGQNDVGGPHRGTIFRMTPAGIYTVLHAFTGTDGASPNAALMQGRDGNLYGTTRAGGAGSGVVFRLRPPRPSDGDFDGDGKADITVYRPSTSGVWYVRWSRTNYSTYTGYQWGVSTDLPVPADYDGDGNTDVAFYRPSTGSWYILLSSTNFNWYASYQWGVSTDVPVVGDYDGDGKADIAVYRPATGSWYILLSSTNSASYASFQWGVSTDVPVPRDYDGDGKTDIAVYRPATGDWYVLLSSTNSTAYVAYQWGVSTDIPVAADYDGDGKADIAVYRPTTGDWYVLLSSTHSASYASYQWGFSTDIPVPSDYDADGKADIAVFRPATGFWYALLSSTNSTTYVAYQWGASTDVPVLERPYP